MRRFTPETARQLLIRLRPTIETLHRLHRELEYRRPERVVTDTPVDPIYFSMSVRLSEGLARLRRHGLGIDDLAHGMIDFPSWLDGRPVMLCWRVGEPDLRFWHEPGEGTARHRLPAGRRRGPGGLPD